MRFYTDRITPSPLNVSEIISGFGTFYFSTNLYASTVLPHGCSITAIEKHVHGPRRYHTIGNILNFSVLFYFLFVPL